MSGPFAIASVTAVLKNLLNDGFINQDLAVPVGSFSVTAVPPDRIPTDAKEPNQINLFLYRVTPNLGWRNEALPSRNNNGERVSNPPLALDLHYLLTCYGSKDFNAEILLGYAMQMLHETPVLTRGAIRTALGGVSSVDNNFADFPSVFGDLKGIDLADQVELIKITPNYLSTEDLSKLWTSMQARYRQSMAYQVSVVLIQSARATKAALPVLKRGEQDRGPEAFADAASTYPILESLHSGPIKDAELDPLPHSYPSARLGLTLILRGANLSGDTVTVVFRHARYSEPGHPKFLKAQELVINPADRTANEIKITLPEPDLSDPANTVMTDWRVGLYSVSLVIETGGKTQPPSNELALVLAPRIDSIAPISLVGKDATLTLTCSPQILMDQTASLLLADRAITADELAADGNTLIFAIKDAPVVTDTPVRLRIDNIDSMPFERVFDANNKPSLQFAANQKVSIP